MLDGAFARFSNNGEDIFFPTLRMLNVMYAFIVYYYKLGCAIAEQYGIYSQV